MSTTALTEETLQLQMLLDGFFKKNTIWSLIEKISEVYITSGQRSKKRCYEDKIEKESLGYINDLKSFVEKHDEKRNYDHMEDSQGYTFNVSFDEYTTVVNAVKSIQQDNESAYTDPLW
ncbi:unnamed protein product [Rhizophagus irregularis]|nr:unnamed protein product [Rhizophagus irregularis]CAB5193159.1 unnamed protein product [Rhizophagus irregularis]